MPITKKHAALALAGAALVQALAYGGYRLMKPPGKGESMKVPRRLPGETSEEYGVRVRRMGFGVGIFMGTEADGIYPSDEEMEKLSAEMQKTRRDETDPK